MLKWIIYLIIAIWMSLEVVLFNAVSPLLGVVGTLAWMLCTALAGLVLMRQQGLQSLIRVFAHLRSEVMPAREMMNMGMILVGSVMLVLPGFFSDIMGALLLLPLVRGVLLTLFRAQNSGIPEVNPIIIEINPDQLREESRMNPEGPRPR